MITFYSFWKIDTDCAAADDTASDAADCAAAGDNDCIAASLGTVVIR